MPSTSRAYRALVGEHSYDVVLGDADVTVDDAPIETVFAPVSGNQYSLIVDGQSRPVVVEPLGDALVRVTVEGRSFDVRVQDEKALLLERFGLTGGNQAAERVIRAPMPGLVVRLLVEPGQTVEEGQGLVVLEAMKMENELRAPTGGVVQAVHAAAGDAVGKNDVLVELG